MDSDFLDRYRYIFRQVLKMSSDGFIVVDKQCVVTDINASYAAFLGKSADEIIGHSIYEIIPNSCMKAVVDTGFSDDLTLHKYEQGYIKIRMTILCLSVVRRCVTNMAKLSPG